MSLTTKEVQEIALLARLHLEQEELERMQSELGTILEHFAVIASVDTENVAPMTHAVERPLALRADDPQPSLPVNEALHAAPRREGDLFVVPAIIPGAD